jgi:hypothetical protein
MVSWTLDADDQYPESVIRGKSQAEFVQRMAHEAFFVYDIDSGVSVFLAEVASLLSRSFWYCLNN